MQISLAVFSIISCFFSTLHAMTIFGTKFRSRISISGQKRVENIKKGASPLVLSYKSATWPPGVVYFVTKCTTFEKNHATQEKNS